MLHQAQESASLFTNKRDSSTAEYSLKSEWRHAVQLCIFFVLQQSLVFGYSGKAIVIEFVSKLYTT